MSFINMDKRFMISKMLTDNYILILLMLVISTHKGLNAFGFDSASSCSPNGKVSRRGRAQMLASIPCDLTLQPYCNLPGASYPWHAVRRFVHENQGLMKRMYGDVRHISVLRDEIRNNEIDIEDIEMAAERYSRNARKRSSKYMHQGDEDYTISSDIKKESHTQKRTTTTIPVDKSSNDDVETTTLSNKLENTNKDATKNNRNPSDNKKIEAIENVEPISKINNKFNKNSTINKIEIESKNETQYTNDDRNLASNSVYELPTLIANEFITPSNNGDNIEIIESPQLNIELRSITEQVPTTPTTMKTSRTTTTTTTQKPTTTSKNTLQTITSPTITTKRGTTNSYIDSYRRRPQYTNRYQSIQLQQKMKHQQLYRINTTIFTTKESLLATNSKQKVNESEQISNTTLTTPTSTLASTTHTISLPSTTASIQKTQSPNSDGLSLISATLKGNIPTVNNQPIQNNTTTEKTPITQFSEATTLSTSATFSFVKPKIELLSGEKLRRHPTTTTNKPTIAPTPSPSPPATKPPVLRDGQLFQDTVKQEPVPAPSSRGINACPVKEEVVAPFWANNTRGEVLALLNLYPFEQYVHWEKCTHEHKQMYCREGCRCEQQYRLHRLLAYDPHNECRGIFSDWFRFPSCCICKCYNIPMDFRATSRSPRMQSFPSDEATTNDSEDHRHPLEIAEDQVKRAIYEHAAEEWYRPRDDLDYYAEN